MKCAGRKKITFSDQCHSFKIIGCCIIGYSRNGKPKIRLFHLSKLIFLKSEWLISPSRCQRAHSLGYSRQNAEDNILLFASSLVCGRREHGWHPPRTPRPQPPPSPLPSQFMLTQKLSESIVNVRGPEVGPADRSEPFLPHFEAKPPRAYSYHHYRRDANSKFSQ